MVRYDAGQYDIEVEKGIVAEPIFESRKTEQKAAQVFVTDTLVACFRDRLLKAIIRLPEVMTGGACQRVYEKPGVIIFFELEKSQPFRARRVGRPFVP